MDQSEADNNDDNAHSFSQRSRSRSPLSTPSITSHQQHLQSPRPGSEYNTICANKGTHNPIGDIRNTGCSHPQEGVQHSNGTLDEHGVCHCTVILPDSTFPANRLEYLEIYNYNLSISVQQQITKQIRSYTNSLITRLNRISVKIFNVKAKYSRVNKGDLPHRMRKLSNQLTANEQAVVVMVVVMAVGMFLHKNMFASEPTTSSKILGDTERHGDTCLRVPIVPMSHNAPPRIMTPYCMVKIYWMSHQYTEHVWKWIVHSFTSVWRACGKIASRGCYFVIRTAKSQSRSLSRSQSQSLSRQGSLDENGVCHCTVILPDSTFPADRIEYLEIYNYNMSISVQQQITKINSYELMVTVYIEKLKDLTKRVEIMETGGLTYTELDFELVKLEIREMESLILELKISLNGSNAIVEALYVEIHNISILVNQLESYDKNNVLVIRREIVALQKRLEECQNHATPLPPVDIVLQLVSLLIARTYDQESLERNPLGTCEHGGLVNISKPFTVQLNWLGFSYKYGGWGKDSAMGANQQLHFVAPLYTDGRQMYLFRTYSSRDDLLLYNTHAEKTITPTADYGQGGGVIMYNNFLYYNCYNSRNLCKLNLQNYVITRIALTDSTYNNRFSYFTTTWQDIDLAGDENGLWVIYSTEQNKGNFVISKLNENSFTIQKTWSTSQYKPAATNAFMVCGVLYATRALDTRTEEIFYMYDTKTGKEGHLSIPLNKMMENIQSLSYNPNDHKLYMYNDGYLVTYDLLFQPVAGEKPKI
ncbi:Hypothetical predicted protein [Pelobates cultripes]|uniref:Olfactomedin-like domain-containing protein n=1 Tax=Pelobates cultripes TaxID=61616 RepID=A0AAD1WM50_PELCU|nr:Hypothetical predicted protein [Pelobates cultripes]